MAVDAHKAISSNTGHLPLEMHCHIMLLFFYASNLKKYGVAKIPIV